MSGSDGIDGVEGDSQQDDEEGAVGDIHSSDDEGEDEDEDEDDGIMEDGLGVGTRSAASAFGHLRAYYLAISFPHVTSLCPYNPMYAISYYVYLSCVRYVLLVCIL